ncbi:hypothetical protein ACIOFV_07475 [Streptomyces mirabilis]|uniref:hypothetical protein n=1 Tax=Streptomyces mirabilis TaxID=68239 RepID=UPI00382D060C
MLTPKPITHDTELLRDRSPIGTRYTCGGTAYTLVAYGFAWTFPGTAQPYLLRDDELDIPQSRHEHIAGGSVTLKCPADILGPDEVLEVAPDDPDKAERARAAALKRYNEPARVVGDLLRVCAFEDLTSDEEIDAFHRWDKAELNLRNAQAVLARAAASRAEVIETFVRLRGSQRKAGDLLGLNQSSISRALQGPLRDNPPSAAEGDQR